MSRTYSIACTKCREHVWIAQRGVCSPTLYSGSPHTMAALKTFLFAHEGHPLIFGDNCNTEIADYKEVDTDEPPKR